MDKTDDEAELNLLLRYPLMCRLVENDATVYKGSIEVNDENYDISVTELADKNLSIGLPAVLTPLNEKLTATTTGVTPRNILTILDAIRQFVYNKIPPQMPVNHCDIYKHVLREYSDFTKFYLRLKSCCLAPDLTKIEITTLDEHNRGHFVEIAVNYDSKDIFQVSKYDLPQDREVFKASSSLRTVYDQFVGLVEELQPFFNLLELFDRNCWILDPVQPKRGCNYRRISIGQNISIILTINPFSISNIPEIKFLGPEMLVETYRSTVNSNLPNWDSKNDAFFEILRLMGMEKFPEKKETGKSSEFILMEQGECSICFSLRLNDNLPEVVCRNVVCQNYYHVECLYEWLMSVNARRFFKEIIGQCPNCEKDITCPIPD